MSDAFIVVPDTWARVAPALWVHVGTLDDPLLRQDHHRVIVHQDGVGRVWVDVSGANAGVRLQTVPPDTHDSASLDGGPR
jgi:hypothetical protein